MEDKDLLLAANTFAKCVEFPAHWRKIYDDKGITREQYILEELRGLNQEFDDLQVSIDRIQVTTKSPVIFDSINFGKFRLSINFDYIDVIAEAITPIYPVFQHPSLYSCSCDGYNLFPHPHIEDDSICLGNGENACDKALYDVRILDAFMIIQSVLNTYSPGTSYCFLEDYNTVICRTCWPDRVSFDNAFRCLGCHEIVCGKHIAHICNATNCHKVLCESCSEYYPVSKFRCDEHKYYTKPHIYTKPCIGNKAYAS